MLTPTEGAYSGANISKYKSPLNFQRLYTVTKITTTIHKRSAVRDNPLHYLHSPGCAAHILMSASLV